MIDRVKKVLARYSNVPIRKMKPESNLIADLGLTSFDLVNVIVAFEDEFEIEIDDDEIKNIQTIQDVLNKLSETYTS